MCVMVQHIVMFKFRADVPDALRTEAAAQFKAGIEALPAVIPFIREVKVGLNLNPAEQWDICLTSTFDSLADAQAYGAHPAHQAVAGALKPLLAGRACVDME